VFSSYKEIEGALCDLVVGIQEQFTRAWLLHPGISNLPATQICPSHANTHRSRLFEFCCVLNGSVLLQVEQQVLRLEKGQVFLLPAGTLHTEVPGHGCCGTIGWFVFSADQIWFNVCALDAQENMHLIHRQRVPIEPITASLLLRDISKELSCTDFGAMPLAKCAVLQTLLLLIRQLKGTVQKLTAQQWRESVVKDILAQLHSDPGMFPDMAQLADRCAMSVNHLNSIFKSVTGKTVNTYCSDLRIERAKQLLETTPIKLRELSEQLGYYDQYHFCKAFKKATGKSPSAYRAEKNFT